METRKLEEFTGKAKEFDAILYVGGFGRKFTTLNSRIHFPISGMWKGY